MASYVRDWSQRLNHPHARNFTYEGVEAFIDGWKTTPFQRRAVQRFLSLMLAHATRLKLRDDNPAAAMDIATPQSKIRIWENPETAYMIAIADAMGFPSMGTAIMIVHEIGQREEDILRLKAPNDYDGAEFRFDQSKTNGKVAIPATATLRARFAAHGIPLHRHLILTDVKLKPYKPDHFRHVFARVRATAGAIMAVQALAELVGKPAVSKFLDVSALVYRQLRHTAVVMLARAGCTVPEIAATTGHTLQTVSQVLQHYLPRDSVVAGNAIAKLETWRNANA